MHVGTSGPYLAWVKLFAIPAPRQNIVTLKTLGNLDFVCNIKVRERPVTHRGALRWSRELRAPKGAALVCLSASIEPRTIRDWIPPPHRTSGESHVCRAHCRDLQVFLALRAAVINDRGVPNEIQWQLVEAFLCDVHRIRWLFAQAVTVTAAMIVVEIELDRFN